MKAIKQIFLLLIPLLLTACVREIWPEQNGASDEWVIPISVGTPSDVIVSTKGTMTDPNTERAVYNIYVLVFDREEDTEDNTTDPPTIVEGARDSKVFGHFFDSSNKFKDATDAKNQGFEHKNYWIWNGDGTGSIHLKSSKSSDIKSKRCTIVAIANLNSEMVNITPDQLGLITNWSEMVKVPAKLLQNITSRSGYFPMSGVLDNVDLSGTSFATRSISLERLDSKIHFKVSVKPTKTVVQENVEKVVDTKIIDFNPLSWQVINVPIHSSVLSSLNGGLDAATDPGDFFNGDVFNFEKETLGDGNGNYYNPKTKLNNGAEIPTHEFSFYMMENKKGPKNVYGEDADEDKIGKPIRDANSAISPEWRYEDRDLQIKEGVKNTGTFRYVDDLATYMILKGRLIIEDENGHKNHAEVKYIIHLGDFGNGEGAHPWKFNDFKVERNHNYTYCIYIQGVDDIRAEVITEGHPENEPGASGQIVVPVKQIFTCDSHFSTHALEFLKSEISANALGWWVKTPFNPNGERSASDGTVRKVNGTPVNTDYKWVEFRVNFDQKDADGFYKDHAWTEYQPHINGTIPRENYKYIINPTLAGNPYLSKKQNNDETYSPTSPTLYVDELMDFLACAAGVVEDDDVDPDVVRFDGNNRIIVTAFVNEYYYEKHPFKDAPSENDTKALWRQFVNQPMRTMCILSSGDLSSPDGESIEETASYIIQQHSIQTVYNVDNNNVSLAWGVEYMNDEVEDDCVVYFSPKSSANRHNDDPDNGRYDTLIEWDLGLWGKGESWDSAWSAGEEYKFDATNRKSWSTYLSNDWNASWTKSSNTTYPFITPKDANVNYEPPFMKSDYGYLRYSCMSRNRDNNGDGKIDEHEVRWYMASSNQLINLFLGSYGIEGQAGLYQRTPEQRASATELTWRQHILGSDINTARGGSITSDNNPRVVWAEQGLNGSDTAFTGTGQTNGSFSTRCVRNLGYDSAGEEDYGKDVTYSSASVAPDRLIVVTPMKNGVAYTGNWSSKTDFQDVYLDVDCSRMNKYSLRYYTDRELAPHDEHSEAACLYTHFRTTSIAESIHWPPANNLDTALDGPKAVNEMNKVIDDEGRNPYCPDGYRLPNVREVGVICYYLDKTARSKYVKEGGGTNVFVFARTLYSFGGKGSLPKSGQSSNEWGWGVSHEKTLMAFFAGKDIQKTSTTRCVKDIKVE